mmetsp:Transcript_27388/g.64861  ORF Transcript_27388/g.64861 Transcript_27388/m.64861 type:complete len:207 (+) Transcript_27388:225-845(+)
MAWAALRSITVDGVVLCILLSLVRAPASCRRPSGSSAMLETSCRSFKVRVSSSRSRREATVLTNPSRTIDFLPSTETDIAISADVAAMVVLMEPLVRSVARRRTHPASTALTCTSGPRVQSRPRSAAATSWSPSGRERSSQDASTGIASVSSSSCFIASSFRRISTHDLRTARPSGVGLPMIRGSAVCIATSASRAASNLTASRSA